MPAGSPTILAASSDLRRGTRSEVVFNPPPLHGVELAGVTGRAPRLRHAGTAGGDQHLFQAWFTEAGRAAGNDVAHLNLFPMPSADDMSKLLLAQDVVWEERIEPRALPEVGVTVHRRGDPVDCCFKPFWLDGTFLARAH